MSTDPREILKAAGIECPAYDEFWAFQDQFISPADAVSQFLVVAKPAFVTKADAAVIAMTKLARQYKWQRDQLIGREYDRYLNLELAKPPSVQSDPHMAMIRKNNLCASLDRRWTEHESEAH